MKGAKTEDFRESFFEECEELLESIFDGFSHLRDDSSDIETVHSVFRAVHSIKGGAAAFGFDYLTGFAHKFENALDKLREGDLTADSDAILLFQRCADHLADQVSAARNDAQIAEETTDGLVTELQNLCGTEELGAPVEEPDFEPLSLDFDLDLGGDDSGQTFRIDFAPMAALFESGNEPVALFRALDQLGETKITADHSAVTRLSAADPDTPSLSWIIELETEKAEEDLRQVFEFVDDLSTLQISLKSPDILDTPDIAPAPDVDIPATVIAEKDEAMVVQPAAKPPAKTPTIRVDLEKIDKLNNLVGELVIKDAILSQTLTETGLSTDSEIQVSLEGLKQLVGEIQEGVMAIRAQPVKPIFQRMSRIVREAAAATGKSVNLINQGEMTEIDKTVIERLVDPLTHMVRNAVDHGIEDAETRQKAGKPPEGSIVLSAAHRSGRVIINVHDDGGGINRDKVRQIAEAKGLVDPEAELSVSEIENLLFLPGFSSKENVSELSGRGVGLDVARSEIQSLGGRVTISSEPGNGTVFAISLPLTLAVMDGMVIEVAEQTIVVPIVSIQETLRPKSGEVHEISTGASVLNNRDRLVPIVDLGEILGYRGPVKHLEEHVLVLVETEHDKACAIVADQILDQRQVVIKSLEKNYGRIDGIAAATILGNGRIALIIDPDSIFEGHDPTTAPDLPEAVRS